ncbi:Spo0E family sporulation regulatory protein-aspartic acid phosphatase [Paenibacillus oryzae]|uniref:Spo0E family sporulation regulatory protein-aspartic acid phosphatase n=1 Tax=Paenibacillus oryzae TaxID=1844972 RepID=UPI0009ED3CBD|nr:Spo0E family sporulation regulatory protein-aspartic acid phosphatase [Paenibacillus oryzae]
MEELLEQLEQLRTEMVETALQEQSLLHRDVLVLSQSLDKVILRVQIKRRELELARKT